MDAVKRVWELFLVVGGNFFLPFVGVSLVD
jgi:hypothetical protein